MLSSLLEFNTFRKEKDRKKEDIWCRLEELAKRNPGYAPIQNSMNDSNFSDVGFGDQEPDVDMSYERVQAESKKVLNLYITHPF